MDFLNEMAGGLELDWQRICGGIIVVGNMLVLVGYGLKKCGVALGTAKLPSAMARDQLFNALWSSISDDRSWAKNGDKGIKYSPAAHPLGVSEVGTSVVSATRSNDPKILITFDKAAPSISMAGNAVYSLLTRGQRRKVLKAATKIGSKLDEAAAASNLNSILAATLPGGINRSA